MDGRMSIAFFTAALLFSSNGCLWPNGKKDISTIGSASSTNITQMSGDAPVVKKAEPGPKRNPQPKTEIAFGELKEVEADSEAGKKEPEIQARLRDEARLAYQHAIKIDPNNVDAYRHLGRLYAKMGDCERAFETYKKAMAKHPKDATLWYEVGLCHHRRKDLAESVKCFNKALELDPENRIYHKKLGFTLAWMGQIDQGLAHLARAQGAALAHCNIARVLIEREDRHGAHQHVTIALRENRELPEAQALLAWLEGPPRPSAALGGPIE